MKADCIFDVSVTGHLGFAQTYLRTEQLNPGFTETKVKDDKDPSKPGESVTFTATVAPPLPRGEGSPAGTVQFILDGGKVGNPVALDSNGRAAWSTSSLRAGRHLVVAQYIPSGWGGRLFLASSSPEESHMVLTSIKSKTNSSLCMGVKHKVSEGANVQLYNCSDTDVHKDWNITTSEGRICQTGDKGAVYCIDFRAGAVDAIVTQEAAWKNNQKWLYDPQDQKFHGHDPRMCLDIERQSPNSQVKVTKCEDWKQFQKWEIQ
jgi:hypothetical protein